MQGLLMEAEVPPSIQCSMISQPRLNAAAAFANSERARLPAPIGGSDELELPDDEF